MTASWFHRHALEEVASRPETLTITQEELDWLIARAEERGALWALRSCRDGNNLFDPVEVCRRARGGE